MVISVALVTGCGAERAVLTIEIEPVADRFELEVTPPSVSGGGGIPIEIKNSGTSVHGVEIIRVEGTRSKAEVVKALDREIAGCPTPSWFFLMGGSGLLSPGASKTSSHLRLTPGLYYAVDSGNPATGKRNALTGAAPSRGSRSKATGTRATGQAPKASGRPLRRHSLTYDRALLEQGACW